MDVNKTLATIRQLMVDQELADDDHEAAEVGWSMVEQFRALDEWLSKGGFLPADWAKGRA